MEMERPMIMNIKAFNREKYCADGVNCANYLRNRFHTTTCKKKLTPYKIIHGKRLNLSHAKRFKAYLYIPKSERGSKFSTRAWEGVFVGYDGGNAFRFYDSSTGQVPTSQCVTLHDTTTWIGVKPIRLFTKE